MTNEILNPYRISYSKAQAFKSCEMKFKYAHIELHENDPKKPGLMPVNKAPALALGTLGHAIMEFAMNELKDKPFPYTQAACTDAANNAIVAGMAMENGHRTMEIMAQIIEFLVNRFPVLGWQILEVEKTFELPIGTDIATGRPKVYPFTVDLVFIKDGVIYIVDWKFAADAYKQERQDVEPQIPGYIGALRALKIPVVHGYYVFLRTRTMKNVEDQVVISPVNPNDTRIRRSFKEHIVTTDKIIKWEQTEEQFATRNANNNCNYCDFSILCGLDLKGVDTRLMKRDNFVANDYGYEDL